ncbi:hypothetical protein [Rhizobium phage RHph_X2_28B]|uniref:hypothetical protein n=1 Tax=Rhizobium phage RHph_X2_28B TaxID=2836086 RepID=UPI0023297F6A|nr:hypothetical protein PP751_gp025 [Rhizobium phage RHph_X2_28B]QWY83477.1 hypothetical protein [Rhizobium phage RHph_X2_28B]QWY83713.1 hypothetical protein [Rhizobium phage RHph_X3_15]
MNELSDMLMEIKGRGLAKDLNGEQMLEIAFIMVEHERRIRLAIATALKEILDPNEMKHLTLILR